MSELERIALGGLWLNNDAPPVTNLITHTTAAGYTGLNSSTVTDVAGKVRNTLAGGGGGFRQTLAVPVTAGQYLAVGAEIMAFTGGITGGAIRIVWRDAALGLISSPMGTTVSAGSRATLVAQAPALTTNALIDFLHVDGVSGDTIDWQEMFTVEQSTAAAVPDYFNGDTPGYYWTGAEGASTSATTPFFLESLSMPVPPSLAEWIKGADSNGAILARPPLHENRVIEAKARVSQQATMDAALAAIGVLLDKLQECGRNANGLGLEWLPADATVDPITFRCLHGEITDLPIDWQDSGWFVRSPAFTIRLTCLPFGEGVEYEAASVVASAAGIVTIEVEDVAGDVPALGRLVVTDPAAQARRYVAWGLESRYYPTSSPPSLTVDSAGMITTGYAGTVSGNVITTILRSQVQAVCGLGELTHVGVFRPQLRFYATATTMAIRLTFQALDGPMRSLSYKVPVIAGWNHADLGLIAIPEAITGTQRWTGRIEAYSTTGGSEVLDVDAVWMMPAELYGRARATYSYRSPVLAGYDDFTAITATTVLNARVSPLGGTWATSGAATDFSATDGPASTDETHARSTASDGSRRVAILGSTNYTAVEVGVRRYRLSGLVSGEATQSVIARWTDSSNFLRYQYSQTALQTTVSLIERVAGVDTTLKTAVVGERPGAWYGLRLIVYPTGVVIGQRLDANGALQDELGASSATLATGGTLATGKPGFADIHTGSASGMSRYYDNFYVGTPSAEPIALHSGQSIQFRHDTTLRDDATGTYAGPPPEYVGGRFTVPNAGGPNRKARVAIIARRNDMEAGNDYTTSPDSTSATVYVTPQYLAVPR